jgi:hypothetical protein
MVIRMGAVGLTIDEILAVRRLAGIIDHSSLVGLTNLEDRNRAGGEWKSCVVFVFFGGDRRVVVVVVGGT